MRLLRDPKRLVPILLSAIAGIIVLIGTVTVQPLAEHLLQMAQIVVAVALVLGSLSVLWTHGGAVWRRARGWPYSMVLVIAAVVVFVLEFVPETSGFATVAQTRELSADVLRYVYEPLATSLLGLLTFFALRASWRALGARPGEAMLILGVAVVFLIGDGPWAAALPGLREALEWTRAYPVQGIARGLIIGAGLGALVATTRLLLGFDHPYLDR